MKALLPIFCLTINLCVAQLKPSTLIRLNQIGFYPTGKKVAIIANETATEFFIASPDQKKKYF